MRALMQGIAERYKALPVFSPEAAPAWMALAELSRNRAATLRRKYEVVEVDSEEEPYSEFKDMVWDLVRWRFRVSRSNSSHPVWTVEDSVAFRICHDIDGHFAAWQANAVADFSFEGELNAARWHERTIPDTWLANPRRALLTEAVGQAAYALHFGHFGVQKVAFLL